MKNGQTHIIVKGARENNLKNVNVDIPKNKLVVFTGVSGSGKSSLAFNTIYEEGRRRYVDSLSSYARQFLGNTQKPLVDSIEGLSPAISIEQKSTHNNPRSTVGTVTEVYDFLRLLYAKVGIAYCPKHKIQIKSQNVKDIIDSIYKNDLGEKLFILAPIINNEKGSHTNLFKKLKQDGFLRVKVNDVIYELDNEIALDKNKKHSIYIVVDRIVLKKESKSRLTEAIELASEYGKGLIAVEIVNGATTLFSKFLSCEYGDFNMPSLEPRLFSFNSPNGMCEKCKGLGLMLKADPNKLIPMPQKTINQGGIEFLKNVIDNETSIEWQQFLALANHYRIPLNVPIEKLPKKDLNYILYGSKEMVSYSLTSKNNNVYKKFDYIEGIINKIERRYFQSTSEMVRSWYRNNYLSDVKCDSCNGQRINEYARSVKIDKLNITEFTQLSVKDILDKIITIKLTSEEEQIAELVINEISDRVGFLSNVGLDYLSLDRKAETLSGGEAQRIRLATQIGSNLTGVLYVLDEPSIGLHQSDNKKLISTLKKMVSLGNTLIVVEHDEETIEEADYIVDIGPWAGKDGGQVIALGTPEELKKQTDKSLTAKYLAGKLKIETPKSRRSGNGKVLEVIGAAHNNLKNIDVKLPLGKLIAVTGISGSGKSTLVNEVISKGLTKYISNPFIVPGKHKKINGIENIDKVVLISQSPIGRTPKSNPATYTSVFTPIRELFAQTQLSKSRGYTISRFSFNVEAGRCSKCRGEGLRKIEMHFLPNVYVKCDLCEGSRFNNDTLEVKYKNKNIYDVLDMTVNEALIFFENSKTIKQILQTLQDVGLGYIKLGQPATTISGGEAQRVKLAKYLQKRPTGKTIYILDEPTTGLHQHDVNNLIKVLNRLVEHGDTVLLIEHNLDMIKTADYIIDLGPGGGTNGGQVVATGSPEQVASNVKSLTGQFLKNIL